MKNSNKRWQVGLKNICIFSIIFFLLVACPPDLSPFKPTHFKPLTGNLENIKTGLTGQGDIKINQTADNFIVDNMQLTVAAGPASKPGNSMSFNYFNIENHSTLGFNVDISRLCCTILDFEWSASRGRRYQNILTINVELSEVLGFRTKPDDCKQYPVSEFRFEKEDLDTSKLFIPPGHMFLIHFSFKPKLDGLLVDGCTDETNFKTHWKKAKVELWLEREDGEQYGYEFYYKLK